MSLRILLQENPRIIVLASGRHALVFRHNPSSVAVGLGGVLEAPGHQATIPKCAVGFTALEDYDLSSYRLIKASGIHGTLGLINVDADVYLCVISAAVKVATVRPDENVLKILSVDFCQCCCPRPAAGS